MEIEFFLPQGPHPTEMEGLEEMRRHLWDRNAPYALKDPDNPLISRQMRPPSKRTKDISH
jgi:hypothetical protein